MKRIRYGIIGGGAWGHCYAEAITNDTESELTVIAEIAEETQYLLKRDFPDITVTADYRELLESDIDVAAVVLPNHLHHKVGRDVLLAGKHLLIEKPFAVTSKECDELIQLAEEKKRDIIVGHQFRLSSLWGKIKTMIDNGFIGRPRYVLIELSRNPFRSGADGWRYDPKRVGDWILEEPIHFLDLAVWYLERFAKPVSVSAVSNATDAALEPLRDNVGANIMFSDGSFAVVAQTTGAFEHHQTVKIVGTNGSLWGSWSGAMDRTRHSQFFLKASDGKDVREIPIENRVGELFELEEQIHRVTRLIMQRNVLPHCTGSEGRFAVRLSQWVAESSRKKTPIIIS
ncbi:MAG: Gfo/Idh/MocA family oxidoreductase [Planctomycetaceae bacterium]|jgi:myo-inositol 2-dehydrogenase/D-chiro-inositol 1-dehydrogenase|nr:Gfo/Idh/MocA family oxidoreductase [Planctomycetaceae bacterium]